MPFVRVTFVRGADAQAQEQLVEDITGAVVERLGVPPQTVSVVLEPVGSDQWAVGGTMLTEMLGKR